MKLSNPDSAVECEPLCLEGLDHLIQSRSLSKIRRIYCGYAGFGQIFRSFSLNSPTIRLKRSKHLSQTSTSSLRSLISDRLLGACPERNRRSRNDIGEKLPCSTAESGFKTPSIVLSYPMQAFSGNMETKRSSHLLVFTTR